MSFITEWLTNIILFILLATVLEMLLPNSSMQRYVKMVVGLLLLVIILNPLLSIFSKDVNDWLYPVYKEEAISENQLEISIERKKSEIELGQRAYISEQVAVQMKRQVENELAERFSMELNNLEISLDEFAIEQLEDKFIEHIIVHLSPQDEKKEIADFVEAVEVISIDTSQKHVSEKRVEVDLQPVKNFLSEAWQIPKEQISLTWEGGES